MSAAESDIENKLRLKQIKNGIEAYICCLTHRLPLNSVRIKNHPNSDHRFHVYERSKIQEWLQQNNGCPPRSIKPVVSPNYEFMQEETLLFALNANEFFQQTFNRKQDRALQTDEEPLCEEAVIVSTYLENMNKYYGQLVAAANEKLKHLKKDEDVDLDFAILVRLKEYGLRLELVKYQKYADKRQIQADEKQRNETAAIVAQLRSAERNALDATQRAQNEAIARERVEQEAQGLRRQLEELRAEGQKRIIETITATSAVNERLARAHQATVESLQHELNTLRLKTPNQATANVAKREQHEQESDIKNSAEPLAVNAKFANPGQLAYKVNVCFEATCKQEGIFICKDYETLTEDPVYFCAEHIEKLLPYPAPIQICHNTVPVCALTLEQRQQMHKEPDFLDPVHINKTNNQVTYEQERLYKAPLPLALAEQKRFVEERTVLKNSALALPSPPKNGNQLNDVILSFFPPECSRSYSPQIVTVKLISPQSHRYNITLCKFLVSYIEAADPGLVPSAEWLDTGYLYAFDGKDEVSTPHQSTLVEKYSKPWNDPGLRYVALHVDPKINSRVTNIDIKQVFGPTEETAWKEQHGATMPIRHLLYKNLHNLHSPTDLIKPKNEQTTGHNNTVPLANFILRNKLKQPFHLQFSFDAKIEQFHQEQFTWTMSSEEVHSPFLLSEIPCKVHFQGIEWRTAQSLVSTKFNGVEIPRFQPYLASPHFSADDQSLKLTSQVFLQKPAAAQVFQQGGAAALVQNSNTPLTLMSEGWVPAFKLKQNDGPRFALDAFLKETHKVFQGVKNQPLPLSKALHDYLSAFQKDAKARVSNDLPDAFEVNVFLTWKQLNHMVTPIYKAYYDYAKLQLPRAGCSCHGPEFPWLARGLIPFQNEAYLLKAKEFAQLKSRALLPAYAAASAAVQPIARNAAAAASTDSNQEVDSPSYRELTEQAAQKSQNFRARYLIIRTEFAFAYGTVSSQDKFPVETLTKKLRHAHWFERTHKLNEESKIYIEKVQHAMLGAKRKKVQAGENPGWQHGDLFRTHLSAFGWEFKVKDLDFSKNDFVKQDLMQCSGCGAEHWSWDGIDHPSFFHYDSCPTNEKGADVLTQKLKYRAGQ